MNRQSVPYLTKDAAGYWRYERRIPQDLHDDLHKKMWKSSLGKDSKEAERKAFALRVEHDNLIAQLRHPAGRRQWLAGKAVAAQDRAAARFAELEAAGAPDGAADQDDGVPATLEGILHNMWRQTPNVLADDDPEGQARHLAAFQAMAFGASPFAEFPDHVPPPRPAGVDGMLFEAYRTMTAEAVTKVHATMEDPKKCLSAMMDAYLVAVNARPQTERHYRQMVRKLVKSFEGEEGGGNRPLPFYTKARMQQHRDRLIAKETISTQTVEKAFAPLKAMWKWAADEHDDLTDLVFPPVRLPRRKSTIEESSWKDFTPQEIKLVWKLLSAEWGPNSKSRLSPSRRAAFLMVVRVMLWTGLRPAEVFRLTPDSVEDGNVLRIRETKTTSRRIPISKHLSDLPDFLKKDGFADCRKSATIRGTFSDNFREIVRPHIADDRKVAYSLKHCLVARLTPIADDHVIRSIIGHKDKSKLRHYRKPLGETEEGRATMKKALDRITYW